MYVDGTKMKTMIPETQKKNMTRSLPGRALNNKERQ
jgi:hypothetical protein